MPTRNSPRYQDSHQHQCCGYHEKSLPHRYFVQVTWALGRVVAPPPQVVRESLATNVRSSGSCRSSRAPLPSQAVGTPESPRLRPRATASPAKQRPLPRRRNHAVLHREHNEIGNGMQDDSWHDRARVEHQQSEDEPVRKKERHEGQRRIGVAQVSDVEQDRHETDADRANRTGVECRRACSRGTPPPRPRPRSARPRQISKRESMAGRTPLRTARGRPHPAAQRTDRS